MVQVGFDERVSIALTPNRSRSRSSPGIIAKAADVEELMLTTQ
jgi:hypothetical protein